ncbi:MAG: 1-(5-phosphoribosyl)-5-((5-phosphoribosylamino)methylideneamino)imidazole-4-carboxamide isomerase [Candidatus Bipolaricaulota bacterium]
MEIYPAIDLMDGHAVRLRKGRREDVTVYGDPLDYAREFQAVVDTVHIIDLDGAFEGRPQNLGKVKVIAENTDLQVQFGGGLRTVGDLEDALSCGVCYPILGTKGLDTDFLEEASYRTELLTVSLDVREGKIAYDGWEKQTSRRVEDVFCALDEYVDRFVFTSIEQDGTLAGIGEVNRFWDHQEVIYAGGISSAEDVEQATRVGFSGVIIGRALYEGELDLKDLVRTVEGEC